MINFEWKYGNNTQKRLGGLPAMDVLKRGFFHDEYFRHISVQGSATDSQSNFNKIGQLFEILGRALFPTRLSEYALIQNEAKRFWLRRWNRLILYELSGNT